MNDLTFAAIKEAELKQKRELINSVTETLDTVVVAMFESQTQIMTRLLEAEKEIVWLKEELIWLKEQKGRW